MGGTIPTNGLKWSNPFRFVFLNETLMYIFTFWDLLDAGNSIQKGTCILAAQHVVLYVLPQHFWRLQVMQRKIGLELQRNNMSTAVPGFERPRKTCFTYSTSKGNFHKWWFIWHSFRHGSTIFANFFLVEKQKRAPHMQQKYLLKHRHLMFGPFCGVAFERYSLRHLQKNMTSFERWSPKGLGQTQPALVIFNWPLATVSRKKYDLKTWFVLTCLFKCLENHLWKTKHQEMTWDDPDPTNLCLGILQGYGLRWLRHVTSALKTMCVCVRQYIPPQFQTKISLGRSIIKHLSITSATSCGFCFIKIVL